MKLALSIFVILTLGVLVQAQSFYGSPDIKVFREGRDKEFRDKKESPLREVDFAGFNGLNYYPEDKSFAVKAKFKRTADEKYFQMPTSSGKMKMFVKYGILKFTVAGKGQTLAVYQIDPAVLEKFPEYADLLFVPFRDLTSKTETYGGGRYIDIKKPQGKDVVLDFNLAYNPNCAYGGDKWSCPIPPRENSLSVAIRAGEKRFAYTGSDISRREAEFSSEK
jgi:uncharacterized protein (DUF1684 family)